MKNKDEIITISKAEINSPKLDNTNRTNAVISCRDIKKIKKRKIADVDKKVSYKQDENLAKTAKKDEAAINKFKKEIMENYKTPKEVLVELNRETEVRSIIILKARKKMRSTSLPPHSPSTRPPYIRPSPPTPCPPSPPSL